jgi:glucose/arabinose dehydrogenase
VAPARGVRCDEGVATGHPHDPAPAPALTRRSLLRGAALAPVAGPLVALVAGCDPSAPRASPGPSPTPSPLEPTPTMSASATPSPSGSGGGDLAPVAERPLADGIDVPWAIAFLPDGDALVSSRDTGRVLHVTRDGRVRVAGRVPGVLSNVDQGGEAGLLGLALHPRFRTHPWLYAYRSTGSGNEVVRLRYDGRRLGPPRVLLDGIAMSLHHNGGGLAFGPDGHLFVSTGDAEDPAAAQDRASLNGKVLRVDDAGGVPRGNPFANPVWSYGHRNVEGLAFDGDRLWAGELGDHRADELNEIVRGGDYGWPDVEGGDGPGGYRDPLASWDTDACSPSGIAVRHGRAWLGALQGQCLWSVVLHGPHRGRARRWFAGAHGRVRAVAAAPDGSLWVGTSNRDGRATPRPGDDRILRVAFR